MPYRSAGRSDLADARVLCLGCAAPAKVSLGASRQDDFVCSRCRLEQRVLPTLEEVGAGTLALAHRIAGRYEELRAFAATLEDPRAHAEGPVELRLACDGVEIVASLSINSGAVMGIDLVTASRDLPQMRLVREDAEHVEAKGTGLVREVRVGDAAFDDAVYIESEAADDAVRVVFASPAVRSATMGLLGLAEQITVGATTISLYVAKAASPFEPSRLRALVRWLRVLAGAPRPLVTRYAAEPLRVTTTRTLVLLLVPLGILFLVIGLGYYTPAEARGGVLSGVGGLVLMGVLQPVLTAIFRGRSTSHRELFLVRVVSLVAGPLLVVGVLITLNGVLDRSPERLELLKIERVAEDSEDDAVLQVTAVDAQGKRHQHGFKTTSVAAAARVVIGRRSGAFGWEWESRPPELRTPAQ